MLIAIELLGKEVAFAQIDVNGERRRYRILDYSDECEVANWCINHEIYFEIIHHDRGHLGNVVRFKTFVEAALVYLRFKQ